MRRKTVDTIPVLTDDIRRIWRGTGQKREKRNPEKHGNPVGFLTRPSHRIRFVYTPKHSSWINQIEIWFGIINRKLLKRKSYLSIEELEASIRRFIEQYNLTAHPFKWTYAEIPSAI